MIDSDVDRRLQSILERKTLWKTFEGRKKEKEPKRKKRRGLMAIDTQELNFSEIPFAELDAHNCAGPGKVAGLARSPARRRELVAGTAGPAPRKAVDAAGPVDQARCTGLWTRGTGPQRHTASAAARSRYQTRFNFPDLAGS